MLAFVLLALKSDHLASENPLRNSTFGAINDNYRQDESDKALRI